MKHIIRMAVIMIALCSVQCGTSAVVISPMRGLVNMGNISFYNNAGQEPVNDPTLTQAYASSFGGMVINVTWKQLQPDGPTALGDDNPIDRALAAIRTYNDTNPTHPLVAKLRVWGGFVAPDWAKAIGGGPIDVAPVNPNTGKSQSGSIGLFWTPEYIQAWRDLQGLLAARYDSELLIVEVGVTSCASDTDEPFVSWLDTPTVTILQNAGYTDAMQKSCLTGAIDDYGAWKNTPVDFPFSLFHNTDVLPAKPDTAFTAQVMELCGGAGNCIMSNHALNEPLATADAIVYTTMQNIYAASPATTRIDFQTASPAKLDWCGAIENATSLHGASVELWPEFGGFTTLTAEQVANLATALQNGTPPDPSLCP